MPVAPAVKSSWNTWIEVDPSAIRRNTAAVCRFVGAAVQVMAILKADGYGHGALAAARAALAGGASWLGVANAAEGAELRHAGIEAPVLVLGCGLPDQAGDVIEHALAQTLATQEMARALSAAALRQAQGRPCTAGSGRPEQSRGAATAAGREVSVHIKVDTGMGRLGVRPHEALAFARLVADLPGLRIEGIYSHLATADHDDASYALEQLRCFRQVLSELAQHGITAPLRHLANSAAVVRFPEMRFDIVRAGLLVYGLNPLARELTEIELRPALSWKSRVACVKDMPSGQRLSYNGLYTTPRRMRIACVPVGYADGFPRALSNVGSVLVAGQRRAVVGAVCMDQMLVDVGGVEAKVGDEVVLIGEQGGQRISANDIAAAQGTVVHEIVARLGKRVPRIHLDDDAGQEPNP